MLSRFNRIATNKPHDLIRITTGIRSLSSTTTTPPPSTTDAFKPRRRPNPNYRPIPIRPRKALDYSKPEVAMGYDKRPVALDYDPSVEIDPDILEYYGEFTVPQPDDHDDGLWQLGNAAAESARKMKKDRERGGALSVESNLRMVDYLAAEQGTTEYRVGERKLLLEGLHSEKERKDALEKMKEIIDKHKYDEFNLGDDDLKPAYPDATSDAFVEEDTKRQVYGEWGETIVKVDRVQKVQRGGTLVRYRCIVIGGNCRGVAGFGIAKANGPKEAAEAASRKCKQNVFYFEKHRNQGLVRDLVGKHNSCKVVLRTTSTEWGLKGHPIIKDILAYFGVADCSARSYGNKNIYNIIYATFKAMMTHTSIEELSLKTGKRFLTLDRARHLDYL